MRRWFGEALSENGIIVHPSQANFLLATFPEAAEGRIRTDKDANWSPFPEKM